MYKVIWNDREGIQRELSFATLEHAQAEAAGLKKRFDYVEISGNTEQLFSVGIQHIKTGERIHLEVWAKNVHEATYGLRGVIGPYTQYRWTGSGPVYRNNEIVTREVPA